MTCSQPLQQQSYHPCVHLPTYGLGERGTKSHQKFPYKIMSFRSSAYFPFERLCVEILLLSITKLVNMSLAEGVFPQKFKVVVTLLIKKASLQNKDLQNYRPVSGQCFMSKLMEGVVVKQLMQHINSNNLDNPRQSTHKSGHSMETAFCV